tara:strand:- start:225 stop:491 length:267 start_codon:yes stop_codon:yes gene_type:complete
MKIFLYKSLFVFFLALILFKMTVGKLIVNYEKKLEEMSSKDNINKIKSDIRDEIKAGIEKDNILSPEDAELINKFLNKLQKELSNANN